jgi:hypothetical protein
MTHVVVQPLTQQSTTNGTTKSQQQQGGEAQHMAAMAFFNSFHGLALLVGPLGDIRGHMWM